jgi:hypothetical protein
MSYSCTFRWGEWNCETEVAVGGSASNSEGRGEFSNGLAGGGQAAKLLLPVRAKLGWFSGHLDRTDLPPSKTPSRPWPIDSHRIRDHHDPDRSTSGLTPVTYPCSRPDNIIFVDKVASAKFHWDINSFVDWEISVGTDYHLIDPVSKAVMAIAGIWNLFGMMAGSGELF